MYNIIYIYIWSTTWLLVVTHLRSGMHIQEGNTASRPCFFPENWRIYSMFVPTTASMGWSGTASSQHGTPRFKKVERHLIVGFDKCTRNLTCNFKDEVPKMKLLVHKGVVGFHHFICVKSSKYIPRKSRQIICCQATQHTAPLCHDTAVSSGSRFHMVIIILTSKYIEIVVFGSRSPFWLHHLMQSAFWWLCCAQTIRYRSHNFCLKQHETFLACHLGSQGPTNLLGLFGRIEEP